MVSESNHYSRNAKVISVIFILYYYLDLSVVEPVIRLGPFAYNVGHAEKLSVVSFLCLTYFAFRFYASNNESIVKSLLRYASGACSKYTRASPIVKAVSNVRCHAHFKRQGVLEYRNYLDDILAQDGSLSDYEFEEPVVCGGGYDSKITSKGLYVEYSVKPPGVESRKVINNYKGRVKAGFVLCFLIYSSAFVLFFLKDDIFWDVLLTYMLLLTAFILLLWNGFFVI